MFNHKVCCLYFLHFSIFFVCVESSYFRRFLKTCMKMIYQQTLPVFKARLRAKCFCNVTHMIFPLTFALCFLPKSLTSTQTLEGPHAALIKGYSKCCWISRYTAIKRLSNLPEPEPRPEPEMDHEAAVSSLCQLSIHCQPAMGKYGTVPQDHLHRL